MTGGRLISASDDERDSALVGRVGKLRDALMQLARLVRQEEELAGLPCRLGQLLVQSPSDGPADSA